MNFTRILYSQMRPISPTFNIIRKRGPFSQKTLNTQTISRDQQLQQQQSTAPITVYKAKSIFNPFRGYKTPFTRNKSITTAVVPSAVLLNIQERIKNNQLAYDKNTNYEEQYAKILEEEKQRRMNGIESLIMWAFLVSAYLYWQYTAPDPKTAKAPPSKSSTPSPLPSMVLNIEVTEWLPIIIFYSIFVNTCCRLLNGKWLSTPIIGLGVSNPTQLKFLHNTKIQRSDSNKQVFFYNH
ncbi:hypothetical protein CYY_002235 [Polysphondylium violaceum]|uniref:Uncharacterized protein n=1 Tax=Polysphondylium violaceum TaxID=133409 RepID=A0A8J4Q0H0_9MYCE|nr:hypothetical protein CYY_002235 [Polysphondylium violaceum]